jgi:putative transposase
MRSYLYHVFYLLNEAEEVPARNKVRGRLPDLKSWWSDLSDVHSKVLQMAVKRVDDNFSALKAQKENGRTVGMSSRKHPGSIGCSPTASPASNSRIRVVGPCCA